MWAGLWARAPRPLAEGAGAGPQESSAKTEIMEAAGAGFRKELVRRLLSQHFQDDRTRVGGDALQLAGELLKIFVVEAAVRSARQAQAEGLARVEVDHLEKVLPQLLLDF